MPGIRRLWIAAAAAGIAIIAFPAGSLAAASAAQRPAVGSTSSSPVGAYHGVACPTSKVCVAVGSDLSLSGKSAVINTATGKVQVWSGTVNMDEMDAVACGSPSACLALSFAGNAVATVKPSTGAMRVTDVPKPPKGRSFALDGIACASATSCYAVGFESSAVSSNSVVIHLSGAGKQLGLVTGSGMGISAIWCPSSTLCLIADQFKTGEVIQLLKGGHLGTSHMLPAKTFIQQIACYQAKVCYALGGNTSGLAPANELFPVNATTGAIGKALKMSGFTGAGLGCASATKCLVVGFTGTQSSPLPALVTVNHGKPGKAARLGSAKASLNDVACASTTVCYAVGTLQGLSGYVIKA